LKKVKHDLKIKSSGTKNVTTEELEGFSVKDMGENLSRNELRG
jgi:hypothetical protein